MTDCMILNFPFDLPHFLDVHHLDLSRNLLISWLDIRAIAMQLKNLQVLNIRSAFTHWICLFLIDVISLMINLIYLFLLCSSLYMIRNHLFFDSE